MSDQWETYAGGAALLGMKPESFRRLAMRKGWRRRPGNNGLAQVAIPVEAIEARRSRPPGSGATHGAMGGAGMVEPRAMDALAEALRQEREARETAEAAAQQAAEAAAYAQGEAAGLREGLRIADAARREAEARAATATAEREAAVERAAALERERDAARGEVAMARDRADVLEAERDVTKAKAAAVQADPGGVLARVLRALRAGRGRL